MSSSTKLVIANPVASFVGIVADVLAEEQVQPDTLNAFIEDITAAEVTGMTELKAYCRAHSHYYTPDIMDHILGDCMDELDDTISDETNLRNEYMQCLANDGFTMLTIMADCNGRAEPVFGEIWHLADDAHEAILDGFWNHKAIMHVVHLWEESV